MEDEVTIRLPGVPAELFAATVRHTHELNDEVTALRSGEGGLDALAGEFEVFLSSVRSKIGRLWEVVGSAADEVAHAPGPTVDVALPVPRTAASRIPVLLAVLEAADKYCERGLLQTPPASPDIRRMRRWITAEVTRQLDGETGRPWPDYAATR